VVNDNVDTNTEYVFAGNTPYNASSNKALAESSVSAAAHKDVATTISSSTISDNYVPTSQAVVNYFSNITGGLTSAMHYKGTSTSAITDGGT